ncbi:MAG: Vi polysaccharide biosynthesis protein VipA/TviB [Flavobacteriales bacterium]|nr:Vi polysaccharide biosynthesis protein VipA/TviB [Flavobacteriales bacterium]
MNQEKICIIGLGYVGLPLAIEFSKKYRTIGFDKKESRINQLLDSIDITEEVLSEDLKKSNIVFTNSKKDIKDCNIYIIAVPTPIDSSKKPNLKFLKNASQLVGEVIKKEDVVIYESTVYPGCTMEDCVPILEKYSSLKLNEDFFCGYSPERINPGDKERTLTKITKITSGSNKRALEIVDKLYSSILTEASTFPVESIEIAEAAKVIENAQRDLNISFTNELAIIFEKMNLDTQKVLDAAGTKWNFMPFRPGLVGGHCIGVDPYYLTYKSSLLGYSPEVILSGRRLNDNMGKYIAQRILKLMIGNSIIIEKSNILVLGITFKENCPDIRNTKVIDLINEFQDYGVNVDTCDPWADKVDVLEKYDLEIFNDMPDRKYDGIVLAVSHSDFLKFDLDKLSNDKTIIFDIKSFLPDIEDRKIYRL